MRVIDGLEYQHGLSLALGFFDGIHLGHAVVIKNAVKFASENSVKTGVILFRTNPKKLFTREPMSGIIDLNDKLNMLSKLGIDNVYLLDFDKEFAKMSAEDYFKEIIYKFFKPSAITTGFNHTFGANGEGNGELLEKYSKEYNFRYFSVPPVTADNHDISSSVIRQAIQSCDFRLAKDLLGYHFYIKSPVIKGNQIGQTINFPTANLVYPKGIVRIIQGVYLVYVNTGGNTYRGILNYGHKPTIQKSEKLIPEVHLLDFSDNLYGKILKISFVAKIRDEERFDSIEQLKEQLEKDSMFARNYSVKSHNDDEEPTLKGF